MVEDNPAQISGIPFVTYFVTNYLGDETETLKHEKILEEQLIKDFELMGNKLELVDDSYNVQLYGVVGGEQTSALNAGTKQTSSTSTTSSNLKERRDSLVSSSRDNSSSFDSYATAVPASNTSGVRHKSRTNLEQVQFNATQNSQLEPQQQTSSQAQTQTLTQTRTQTNQPGQLPDNLLESNNSARTNNTIAQRRPLGDAIANSDEQEHFERLILMDIEGKLSPRGSKA